jgi:hypothetical protein
LPLLLLLLLLLELQLSACMRESSSSPCSSSASWMGSRAAAGGVQRIRACSEGAPAARAADRPAAAEESRDGCAVALKQSRRARRTCTAADGGPLVAEGATGLGASGVKQRGDAAAVADESAARCGVKQGGEAQSAARSCG